MIWYEKFFTKDECEKIKNYSNIYNVNYDLFGKHKDKIINNKISTENFSYNVYLIPNDENTEWFFNKLMKWFEDKSGKKIDWSKKVDACTLHKYSEGEFFERHIDIQPGFEWRRYNIGLQLSDESDYEGGEYSYWDAYETEYILPKEIGTIIAYDSTIPHEIKKITKGNRWSIVMQVPYWNFYNEKNKGLI